MKTTVFAVATFTLLAAASPLAAQSEPASLPGSVAKLTLALKRSYSSPGVGKRDEKGKLIKKGPKVFLNIWEEDFPQYSIKDINVEWISAIKTEKYSNRELLADLIELEVLPKIGKAPFLAGWSLQRAAASIAGESAGDAPSLSQFRFFAKHKDGTLVDISNILKIYNGPAATKWKSSVLEMYSTFMGMSLLETRNKLSATEVDCSFMELDFRALTPMPDDDESNVVSIARFQGMRTSGFTLTTVGKGASKVPVIKLAASKTSGISGYGLAFDYKDGENGENPYQAISVFSGSLTSPAGAVYTDVSSYFPDDLSE
jgi:hypothetical protein